ncbi:MAG: MauE/DoxX family redox-associated membrane protein, partial [Candidatus Dormibacteraceae bacterium]
MAALLCVPATAAGPYGALLLLVTFSAVVGANFARGRTPGCHCFGRFSKASIGWSMLGGDAQLARLGSAGEGNEAARASSHSAQV